MLDTTELRLDPFRKILECVKEHTDRDAFLRCEQTLNLQFPLKFFEELDAKFGAQFRDETEKGNRVIRTTFEAHSVDDAPFIPENIRYGTFHEFCKWFRCQMPALNFSATVSSLANRVVDQAPFLPVDKVHDSYDGSINLFVEAFSIASMKMTANMDLHGRNDALDLAHFLFMSHGDTLATDDRKMRALAESMDLSVVGADDIKRAMHIIAG